MSELGRCILAIQDKNVARMGEFSVYRDESGAFSPPTVDTGIDFTHLYIMPKAYQNSNFDGLYAYVENSLYRLDDYSNANKWTEINAYFLPTYLKITGQSFVFTPNYGEEGETRDYLYFAW